MILVNGQVIGVKKWSSKDGSKTFQVIGCSFAYTNYGHASVDGSDVHQFWVSPDSKFKVGQAVKIGIGYNNGQQSYEVIENG